MDNFEKLSILTFLSLTPFSLSAPNFTLCAISHERILFYALADNPSPNLDKKVRN